MENKERGCLLRAEHLFKYFGKGPEEVRAVDDVSFWLNDGETVGIVGESGCGKSTLAKLLVRLLEADRGELFFRDIPIHSTKEKELRKIRPQLQLVFQNPFSSMNPRLTLRSSLMAPLNYHRIGENRKEREELLCQLFRECGLKEEFLDRYPYQLSGGQLQRAGIARAISLNPRLLIADEVVSALDVAVQEQILELLIALKEKRKMSILFISHDLAVIRRISNRILVMKNGKIIEEKQTKELFANPEHPYTRELINSMIRF